ncbi:MAG: integrase [Frondihabitans sp.]|nr:integrase [Frondihabitans sp.]
MSRQRLTIGTFGDIGFLPASGGRTVARARYRDWDGKTRLV